MSDVRFARQILLAEIGEAGQARLCAHGVEIVGDAGAAAIAGEYLARAGVGRGETTMTVASGDQIDSIAGRIELREAAAFLLGSLAAVEEIKRVVGAGAPVDPLTIARRLA